MHLFRWIARTTLLLTLLLAAPGVARAHPEIVETEPAPQETLDSPPDTVHIRFNETLEGAFSSVELFDSRGQRVPADGGLAGDDPAALTLALPPLDRGIYTVVWTTVGSDGHKVTGNFSFTVGGAAPTGAADETPQPAPTIAPAPPPAVSATETPPPISPAPALLRAMMLLGTLAACGGLITAERVLQPAVATSSAASTGIVWRRSRGAAMLALLLLAAAIVGFALVQTAELAGRLDGSALIAMLSSTRLGQALIVRAALAAALAALIMTTREFGGGRAALAIVLSGALLLSFSLAGHAAAQGSPTLPVIADWLHLVAAAVWVGGLITLAAVLPGIYGALQPEPRANVLAQVIVRFSTLALISVLVLMASGTYGALLHLPALDALWTSDYGRALLVKVGLFGALIAFGAYHMFVVRPRFTAWVERAVLAADVQTWQRRFLWAVRGEVGLALLVLGAVGVMTSTAPPADRPARASAQTGGLPSGPTPIDVTPLPTITPVPSEPFAETRQAGDLRVSLDVAPASLGTNEFVVTVRDAQDAPVDVQKVVLSLDMLAMEMGTETVEAVPAGEGRYVAAESWLSMVGEWQVTVVVRRADADDVEAVFAVPVGG